MATYDYTNIKSVAISLLEKFGATSVIYEEESSISGNIFENRVENVTHHMGKAAKLPLKINKGRAEFLSEFDLDDLSYFYVVLDSGEVRVNGILNFESVKYKIVYVENLKPDGVNLIYQQVYGKLQR